MEQAFEDFIKENWPGFHNQPLLDFEDRMIVEHLKEAFETGWNAKLRDIIDRY